MMIANWEKPLISQRGFFIVNPLNPFRPEFIIEIFIHYKHRIAVPILHVEWMTNYRNLSYFVNPLFWSIVWVWRAEMSSKKNQSQGLIQKVERGFDSSLNFNPYHAEIFLCKPWESTGYFQFEIIINVIVSYFCLIWIPMLAKYC